MPENLQEWLSLALWLSGAGHFCVLIASFQVPHRLRWKEDLAKLTSFNKLMWVHGGFTVYTIIAFGAMSLTLHEEMLRRAGPGVLHRSLLAAAHCRRSCLLLGPGLADRQALPHRTRLADILVRISLGQLSECGVVALVESTSALGG